MMRLSAVMSRWPTMVQLVALWRTGMDFCSNCADRICTLSFGVGATDTTVMVPGVNAAGAVNTAEENSELPMAVKDARRVAK